MLFQLRVSNSVLYMSQKVISTFIMKVINCLRRIMNFIFEIISSLEEHMLLRNNTHTG